MRKHLWVIIPVLLAPPAILGQPLRPMDLAGEWVFAHTLYGETGYARVRVEFAADRLTLALWNMKLDGGIHDGKVELKRSKDKEGPAMSMTGKVERDGMAGEFTVGELKGN